MKKYICAASVFAILSTGCSANYSVKNFSSNGQYYEEFNRFAKNSPVEVVFANDSSVSVKNGAVITNDSIYAFYDKIKMEYYKVPSLQVKDLFYTASDYKAGDMLMNDNRKIKAINIRILQDSIEFTGISTVKDKTGIAPVNEIKEVDYKNRWMGMLTGFGFSSTAGGVALFIPFIAGIFKVAFSGSNNYSFEYMRPIVIGAVSFIGIGTIAGWILGDNRTYSFNR